MRRARPSALALFVIASVVTTAASVAHAKCEVTIKAHNSGPRPIYVDGGESAMKLSGHAWVQLWNPRIALAQCGVAAPQLAAGSEWSQTCTVRYGCNARRRFRFTVRRGQQARVRHYPDQTGYMTATTIDLGDLDAWFEPEGTPAAPPNPKAPTEPVPPIPEPPAPESPVPESPIGAP